MTNGEAKKRRSGAFSARLSGCGCLPNWLGFLSFTLLLTRAVGCGPDRHRRMPADRGAALAGGRGRRALGVIIGARVSDTLVSHWGLRAPQDEDEHLLGAGRDQTRGSLIR